MKINEAIKAFKDADSETANWDSLINSIEDRYIQGYMTCKLRNLYNTFASDEPELKEELIKTLEDFI